MRRIVAVLVVLIVLALGWQWMRPDPAVEVPAAAASSAKFPVAALPDIATPLDYQIELSIDPNSDRFSGDVSIRVMLNTATDTLWMHGEKLRVRQAEVITADGERLTASYAEQANSGVVKLTFPRALAAQELKLHFSYDADFDQALNGLYRVKDAGENYAFTQMESHYARKAIPSFDEPRFKVPFTVSLIVPNEQVAIANTPLVSSEDVGNGRTRMNFAPSKALPTYLLAWAVGPLDVVDWQPIAASELRSEPIPLRGVAAKGKGARMHYALENTAAIVQNLESYFGIAYPYEKLDIIAVPDFESGAMENAGAITYREQLLLLDANSSLQEQRAFAATHAHELAHQWFGDLVTMPWWNDIWLNEAFASWMENKAVHAWRPDLGFELANQTDAVRALQLDALASMRQIRQPIASNDEISSAFDGITYAKGAAVIAMFEKFVGAEVFQRGVTDYLNRYAWGNATSEQFVQAIATAAGDARVEPAFFSFLTQVGVPQVSLSWTCSQGQISAQLTQQRYLPLGSTASADQRWQIPICVSSGKSAADHCTLLSEPEQEWRFSEASCPEFLMPNAAGAGYYRFTLADDQRHALVSNLQNLSLAESFVLIDNIGAAFRAGTLNVNQYLEAMPAIARHPSREVATLPLTDLTFIRDYLGNDAERATLAKRYLDWYQPRLDAIGLLPRPNENADTRLLRTSLVPFLTQTARSESLRATLSDWGSAYIGFKTDGERHIDAAPADLRGEALIVASQQLGAPFYQAMLEQLLRSQDGRFRQELLVAMAMTDDADLSNQVRDLILDPRLRTNERFVIAYAQMNDPIKAEQLFAWFKEKYSLLRPMVPEGMQKRIPGFASRFCSAPAIEEVHNYFNPLMADLPGGQRSLDNALESISLCQALVAAQPPLQLP